MGGLTDDMKRLVREQKAGLIATVCPDGTPNLSAEGHYRPLDTLGRPSQAPIGRSRKSCWMKRSFATGACSSGPVSPASAANRVQLAVNLRKVFLGRLCRLYGCAQG